MAEHWLLELQEPEPPPSPLPLPPFADEAASVAAMATAATRAAPPAMRRMPLAAPPPSVTAADAEGSAEERSSPGPDSQCEPIATWEYGGSLGSTGMGSTSTS